jgi:hypothetical protein
MRDNYILGQIQFACYFWKREARQDSLTHGSYAGLDFNIFHFTTQKWIFIKFPFKCRSTSKILIFDLRPVLSITGSIDLLVKFSVF